MKEKLVIYIPTFNEESRVEAAIESAFTITDHVLILDNNSTDSTLEIARRYKNVSILSHDYAECDYIQRIKLVRDFILDNFPNVRYFGFLNCSEIFSNGVASQLHDILSQNYSAIAIYRRTITDGYETHPYHLIYLVRAFFKSHRQYRFIKLDEWNENNCKIHAEIRPHDFTRSYSLSPFKSHVLNYRKGDISLVEKKHIEYSQADSLSSNSSRRSIILLKLFISPLGYFLYNLPYIIFSYSDQRLITTIQHCYYIASVYLRVLKNKV